MLYEDNRSMKVINKILATIGVIAIMVIGLFFWLSIQSSMFTTDSKPFIDEYLSALSVEWRIQDVKAQSTTQFMQMVTSPAGLETVQEFSKLGAFVAVSDFERIRFQAGVGGNQAVYQFKAKFSNSSVLCLMEIVEIEGKMRVQGLRFNLIEPMREIVSRIEA